MEYVVSENPEMTLYKANTDETFEDLSVERAVEIINDTCKYFRIDPNTLQQVDPETGKEKDVVVDFVGQFVSHYGNDFTAFSERGIEIDRELVVRAVGGLLIEKEWDNPPSEFGDSTPHREQVRDFILRKVGRFRRTEHILVDVEPYHPLQEWAKRWGQGELEEGSDDWKIEYAKAFEGFCPKGWRFSDAYEYADEFELDIDFADEIDYGPLVSK